MALDDSIFKSAIARINRVKPKSTIPQVLVFEDPPHLKKLNNAMPLDNIDKAVNNESEAISQAPTISSENSVVQNTAFTIGNNQGTKHDTESSIKQGTEKVTQQNKVQKSSTIAGTKEGTKQGTEKSYNIIKDTDFNDLINPVFIYQRPYDALSGIPKKIVDIIFELCRKYGGTETPPVPFAMIVRLCNEKKNSVKVTRQRLLDEGIIITKNSFTTPAKGRSGMLIYKLRDDIFEEINDSLSLFVRKHDLADKKGTKHDTEKGTRPSSSSSYLINTTTTDLPDEWKKIDVTPLATINFGMTEIKNIYRKCAGKIHPETVQDSINQFAFGLTNNPDRYKGMNAPSGVLVKTLSDDIPWKESGYISVEEKLRIERESKVVKLLEKQIKEPKFLEWFNQLTDEAKDRIVPNILKGSASYTISKSIIEKEQAKNHFDKCIWPEMAIKLKMEFLQH